MVRRHLTGVMSVLKELKIPFHQKISLITHFSLLIEINQSIEIPNQIVKRLQLLVKNSNIRPQKSNPTTDP